MSFDVHDYGVDFQQLVLNVIITDADIFVRCQNILKPEYFQGKHSKAVDYILEYANKYSTLPTIEEIQLKSACTLQKIPELNSDHHQGFLDTIEDFCRHKALEHAVIEGMEFVKKRQYGKVEALVKDAMMVSLQRDLGTNYFYDPAARNKKLFDAQGTVSTGWSEIDYKLSGGFGTGELEIFVAPSGGGKSVALQNITLNFSAKGLNGVYITLELKEELVSQRMDSMLLQKSKTELLSDLIGNGAAISIRGKKMGSIHVKRMPESTTTTHDIKAYLKELQIKTGIKLNYIAVDYLDLLTSSRIDPSDTFMKDKYVCEELRALAHELDITVITASQLNRSAVEETTYNHSNIAGGISKIYTADNVIGIFNTEAFRQRGEIQFQFMKTRNSSGVGSYVNMGYSIDTLLITDHPNASVPKPSMVPKVLQNAQGAITANVQKQDNTNTGMQKSAVDRLRQMASRNSSK